MPEKELSGRHNYRKLFEKFEVALWFWLLIDSCPHSLIKR